jgi:prevent-host-death family protein
MPKNAKQPASTLELDVSDARQRFAEAVNEVLYGKRRIILVKHGRRVVAMISVAELARFEALEDRVEGELAEEALAEPGRIPLEEVRRRRKQRRGRKK